MSDIALESEDLENVPLVRMEDVQPSRERSYEVIERDSDEDSVEEVLGSCVIEDIVYDTEYIVNNDEDSNIGSMVSIKSEDVPDDNGEMIVPEIMDDIPVKVTYKQRLPESSWPTLEILPGGVIQKPDKSNTVECTFDEDFSEEGEMMYACAKCSQSFKFLYCLVKHVKWHEDEAKKLKKISVEIISKTSETTCTSQSNCKHTTKQNVPIKQNVPSKQNVPINQNVCIKQNIPIKQHVATKQNIPTKQHIPTKQNVPTKQTVPIKQNVSIKQNVPKRKMILAIKSNQKKLCIKKFKS